MDDTGSDEDTTDTSDWADAPSDDEKAPDTDGTESDGGADDDESDDETDDDSDDDGSDGKADADAGDEDESRLEDLGDRIESVRAQAEEAGIGEPDEKYHESGSDEAKEADDQNAAPG